MRNQIPTENKFGAFLTSQNTLSERLA